MAKSNIATKPKRRRRKPVNADSSPEDFVSPGLIHKLHNEVILWVGKRGFTRDMLAEMKLTNTVAAARLSRRLSEFPELSTMPVREVIRMVNFDDLVDGGNIGETALLIFSTIAKKWGFNPYKWYGKKVRFSTAIANKRKQEQAILNRPKKKKRR